MKIALDARFLTHPQAGGFKTYTLNLVRALAQIDSSNEYLIYVDRDSANDTLPQTGQFTYRILRAWLPLVGMPIREQLILWKQLISDKPDVAHFLCNTAPVLPNGRVIITLHDTIQVDRSALVGVELKQWAMTAYARWSIVGVVRAARRVITTSQYEKGQIVRRLGVPPERICVTPLAGDPVFAPASTDVRDTWRNEIRLAYGLTRPFVLGVGHEPRKNIPLLIDAFARLAAGVPELDLVVVVAEPSRRRYFRRLGAQSGLSGRLTLLGGLAASELTKLYNLAEVFVFPSEREGFGLPPLEAMACGAPTIAMRMSAIPEVVGDGCLLLDSRDPQAWATAMLDVLANPTVREDLIARGLRRAASLNWQRCAQETLEIYRAVAAER